MPLIINGFIRIILIDIKDSDLPKDMFKLSGIMFATPFHYGIGTNLVKNFYQLIRDKIGDRYEISLIVELTYYSLQIWSDAIDLARQESSEEWPSNEVVHLTLRQVETELPSSKITIANGNYIERFLSVLEIDDSGDFLLVFPNKESDESLKNPNPHLSKSEIEACSFGIKPIDYEFNEAVIPFSIFYTITLLLIFGFMFLMIKRRDSKITTLMSLFPSIIFMFGCIMCVLSGFFFLFSPLNTIMCHFRFIFLSIGLSFIMSDQLSKIINKVVVLKKQANSNEDPKNKVFYLILISFVLLQIIMTFVYLFYAPSKYSKNY